MVALFLQTLLLMAVAYVLGAALACVVRRSLFTSKPVVAGAAERRVDPLPDVPQRGSVQVVPIPSAAPVAAASPAAAVDAGPPDDLQRIHRIDAALEADLNKLGIRRYKQIAAWMRADVTRIGGALSLGGRINQENWIEQAQVLAKGGDTHYARRRARGEGARAEPTPDEGDARNLVAAAPARAVDAVTPPADIATAHASPAAVESALRSMPAAQPVRPSATASDNLQRIGGIDAAFESALATQGVTRYWQIAHWSPADVTRIDRELNAGGRIARENWIEQAQILSRGGDTAFSRQHDAAGGGSPRPVRLADAMEEQAARTTEGTKRSSASQLAALRSVRSEAYQSQNVEPGPEAAHRAVQQSKLLRPGASNDLKRIRGIGVLIEKRLNAMGIVGYEQIANWTAQDIERVSRSLDFKGRIERENWIEQARILASGGATEFSRRVDRGEVETSRAKT